LVYKIFGTQCSVVTDFGGADRRAACAPDPNIDV